MLKQSIPLVMGLCLTFVGCNQPKSEQQNDTSSEQKAEPRTTEGTSTQTAAYKEPTLGAPPRKREAGRFLGRGNGQEA